MKYLAHKVSTIIMQVHRNLKLTAETNLKLNTKYVEPEILQVALVDFDVFQI